MNEFLVIGQRQDQHRKKTPMGKVARTTNRPLLLPRIVGERGQALRIANEEFLSPCADETFGLPRAHDARDRMQRCSGHFGDVLLGEGKVDPDAILLGHARLPGEPQNGMGDAALHLFCRHFPQAGVRFLEPLSHRLDSADGQGWIFLDKTVPKARGPSCGGSIDNGRRGTGIVGALQRPSRKRLNRRASSFRLARNLFRSGSIEMSWRISRMTVPAGRNE